MFLGNASVAKQEFNENTYALIMDIYSDDRNENICLYTVCMCIA